jgi:hypothetical protein
MELRALIGASKTPLGYGGPQQQRPNGNPSGISSNFEIKLGHHQQVPIQA